MAAVLSLHLQLSHFDVSKESRMIRRIEESPSLLFAVTHNTFQLSTFTEVLSVVQSQRLKQKRIFRKFLAKICVKTYLQTINFHVRSSPYNLLTPLISTAFSQPCILQYNVSPSRMKCTSFLRFHRIRMETSSMNSEGEIL